MQTPCWRHWKREGELYADSIDEHQLSKSGTYYLSADNITRMLEGKAPLGLDGYSVQLHHLQGITTDFYDYIEILATNHWKFYKILHWFLYEV